MVDIAQSPLIRGTRAWWRVQPDIPTALLTELGGLSPMLCHLLYCRGYRTTDDIAAFFTVGPPAHDPRLMPDMDRAVSRISRAIGAGERVAIYGDFDCDGLTATAVLEQTMHAYGLSPVTYVPEREEGHGLHPAALHELAEAGVTLIVTADCGVTALEEVSIARQLGMDVVITDHHEPRADGSLPDCPVVDPIRHDSMYPCRYLSGVGVAFKLVQALAETVLGGPSLDDLLDLVALGTVADVVPLRDENRSLVARGLQQIRRTRRPGLLALFRVAGVEPERIDPTSVSFYLAPRINAANRLASPRLAYSLLTARNDDDAMDAATRLSEYNRQRQVLVEEHLQGIVREIGDPAGVAAEVASGRKAPVLVHIGPWAAGISGLLASKLVDLYGLPAFVGCADDEMVAVSARGVPGVYIDEILERCEAAVPGGLFAGYGGHARAAGFRVARERWPIALDILEQQSREQVHVDVVGSVLVADAEVPLRKLTHQAALQLQSLAPFGNEFGEPLFLIKNVSVRRMKPIGGGKHARMTLQQDATRTEAVLFHADPVLLSLPANAAIDVLCSLQINEWRGSVTAELHLRDWRPAEME